MSSKPAPELFNQVSHIQELALHILSFLEASWKEYATIPRAWRIVFERRTFASPRLKSNQLELFASTYVSRNQRAALKYLCYDIILPTYDDVACSRFETERDKEANDMSFSKAVHGLFAVLKDWEQDTSSTQTHTKPKPLTLFILGVHSPCDKSHRDTDLLKFQIQDFALGRRRDLWEHRYEHSVIKLEKWEELPILSRINKFHVRLCGPESRVVDPQAVPRIASKLPSLEVATWRLSDNEKKYFITRQQLRTGKSS